MPRAPVRGSRIANKNKKAPGPLTAAIRLSRLRIPHAGITATPAPEPKRPLTIQERWDALEYAMPGVRHYWQKVLFFARHLDKVAARDDDAARAIHQKGSSNRFIVSSQKEIWLCSVATAHNGMTAGRIIGATCWLAAQRLVDGTHRLATKKEVTGWHAEQKQRKIAAEMAAQANLSVVLYQPRASASARVPPPPRPNIVRDIYGNPIPPLPPISPGPELLTLQQLGESFHRWALNIWNPRARAVRLYFYRPSPDNDDWLTDPAKRAKVLERVVNVLDWRPAPWVDLIEHWEYLAGGFICGAVFSAVLWMGR